MNWSINMNKIISESILPIIDFFKEKIDNIGRRK